MNGSEILTHSRLACFRACPRKHLYRYEYGIRPAEESDALRVGSAFALAVETEAKGGDVEAALAGKLEDPYELALVAAMFNGHIAYWANDPTKHVEAEKEFSVPLVNPETGMPSRTFLLGGKIDRLVEKPGPRLVLREYKTTSKDFSPGSPYWLRLSLDAQLSLYVIGSRGIGFDIDTIEYDVTLRPSFRPLKATPEDARKYTKDGRLYANQRDKDETPEEFAARVAAAIAENPSRFFARVEIARTDADIEEFRHELWSQAKALREAQLSDRWFRNPEACVNSSGYVCEYLPICHLRDLSARTPEGFRRVDDLHPELNHASSGQAE